MGFQKTTWREKKKMCIKIQSMSEKMEFQTLAERQVFGGVRQKLCPVKLCARNAERCPKETSSKERKGTSQSERSGVWVKFSGTLLNGPLSAWALTRKSVNSFPSGLCDHVMHGPLRLPQAFRLRPWWGVGKSKKKILQRVCDKYYLTAHFSCDAMESDLFYFAWNMS